MSGITFFAELFFDYAEFYRDIWQFQTMRHINNWVQASSDLRYANHLNKDSKTLQFSMIPWVFSEKKLLPISKLMNQLHIRFSTNSWIFIETGSDTIISESLKLFGTTHQSTLGRWPSADSQKFHGQLSRAKTRCVLWCAQLPMFFVSISWQPSVLRWYQ